MNTRKFHRFSRQRDKQVYMLQKNKAQVKQARDKDKNEWIYEPSSPPLLPPPRRSQWAVISHLGVISPPAPNWEPQVNMMSL